MKPVLRHAHFVEQLGEDPAEEPGLAKEFDPDRRAGRAEELHQLVAHALARHARHAVPGARYRGQGRRVHRELEHGGEADAAQGAQAVLAEAGVGVPHRADHARGEILDAPFRVDQRGRLRIEGHRVHGEVAPGEVLLERRAEVHPVGVAAVGVRPLGAVGGDLHRSLPKRQRDRPVTDPGGHRPRPQFHDRGRRRRGGDVPVQRRLVPEADRECRPPRAKPGGPARAIGAAPEARARRKRARRPRSTRQARCGGNRVASPASIHPRARAPDGDRAHGLRGGVIGGRGDRARAARRPGSPRLGHMPRGS